MFAAKTAILLASRTKTQLTSEVLAAFWVFLEVLRCSCILEKPENSELVSQGGEGGGGGSNRAQTGPF